jgi:catalase
MLAEDKPAKDFVSDAFAHCKFIGYTSEALPLITRAGVREADFDEGLIEIGDAKSAKAFLKTAGKLRLWEREFKVDLDAAGFLAANT